MEIRRIQPGDALDTACMIERTLAISNAGDYSPGYLRRIIAAYCPERIREQAQNGHMYVACEAGRVIGCGAISASGENIGECMILSVFVAPEHQGKGLGRQILQTLEQDPYFLYAGRIELHASITAVEFYRKMGYAHKGGTAQLDEQLLYTMEKFR